MASVAISNTTDYLMSSDKDGGPSDEHEANEKKMRMLAVLELQRMKLENLVHLFEAIDRNDHVAAEQVILQDDEKTLHKHSNSFIAMAEKIDDAEMIDLLKRHFRT